MRIKSFLLKTTLVAEVLFSQVSLLYAQKVQNDMDLRKELDYMFARIDRQSVPTGLLMDYAIELEDVDKFETSKGVNSDNLCDASHIRNY